MDRVVPLHTWIILLLCWFCSSPWIYLTYAAYSEDCNFSWNITKEKTLFLRWEGNNITDDSKVKVSLNASRGDESCPPVMASIVAFSQKNLSLLGLCANTEYLVVIDYTCEDNITRSEGEVWTPPGPPLNVGFSNKTDSGVIVLWTTPTGSGVIEVYQIWLENISFMNVTNTTQGPITGLQSFTNYSVQVSAKNRDFWGDPSEAVQVRTSAGVPSAPVNLNVSYSTNTSIYVTWDDPVPYVGPIERFEVTWKTTDGPEDDSITDSNFFDVTDLLPYVEYTVKVRAKTTAGFGNWSDSIIHRTGIGVPSAPANLSISYSTSTSIHLTWDDPVPFVGPIERFEVTWKTTDGPENSTITNSNFFSVTDLLPYMGYTVKVRAETTAGFGSWSDAIMHRTGIGVPHVPRNLKNGTTTNTSVELMWDAPSPPTGPILHYIVLWSNSSGNGELNTRSEATKYLVTNVAPYVNYTFSVQAETEAGRGNVSGQLQVQTAAGTPHAPKNAVNGIVRDTSVELMWEEPSPFTGHILFYMVLWRNSSGSGEINTTSAATKHTVMNLAPYVKYIFQIQAATVAGRGGWSAEIEVLTAPGIPHAPQNFQNGAVTNTSVLLTWEEPSPSTGPILYYTVLWSNSSDRGDMNTSSALTKYTVQYLTPFVNYTFAVQAVTEAGKGSASKEIQVETATGVPHAPKDLEKGIVGSTSVELSWKEPTPSTGPILHYVVRWSNSSGSGEHSSSSETHIMENLSPYVNYTFAVRAATVAGEGSWSNQIEVQTAVGVPHAPRNLHNGTVTNTSVQLIWQEPSPSTGPILYYTIMWNNSSGKGERNTSASERETRYSVMNLAPFAVYTFHVQAVTYAGKGSWSNPIQVRTAVGISTAPLNLRPEHVTDASVHVKWDEPTFPRADRLVYDVRWNNTPSEEDQRLTELTALAISKLLPCTSYSIRVSALTAAGRSPWTDMLSVQTSVGAPEPAIIEKISVLGSRSVTVGWMTTGVFPGPVNYSIQAWKKPEDCSSRSASYMAKELKGSKDAYEWRTGTHVNRVEDLAPYGSYAFLIMLSTTAKEVSSAESEIVTLDPEMPGEPSSVLADCGFSPTEVKLNWKPPDIPNGLIDSYVIEYILEGKRVERTVPVKDGEVCKKQFYVLSGLRPEKEYQITVRATVNNVTQRGRTARPTGICKLPAGIPFVGNTSRLRAEGSSFDRIVLHWSEDTFSDYMGTLIYYSVLVGTVHSLGNATSGKFSDIIPPWSNFSAGVSDYYQATPPRWNPFTLGSDPLKCVKFTEEENGENTTILRCFLGSETSCLKNETYCNGPLNPDTNYEMKIRAFTRGGFTETDPLRARTGPEPRRGYAGIIAGVLVFFLLLLCLAAGGYVIKKKGYLQPIRDAIGIRIGPIARSTTESALQMDQRAPPKPIKVTKFAEHVRVMMADSHLKFSQEFEKLKAESPQLPCTAAEMEENRHKNRWVNILPFDHSRVKILPLGDEPGSDFINASYIPGHSSLREYIASQGPLPHTVDELWRMAWEQSVSTIVMLTQCVERGKKKCEQYWPDPGNSKYYGDLRVSNVSESMLSSYIIRVFHVQLGSHERRVKQMHFTHWPDFGCPESPEDLINFVRAVRDHHPRVKPGPILVHCSAGVGRTGTFIAVDRLSQQLKNSDTVNVYGTVLELRHSRTNMVQTEDQYIYIHLCVRQLLQDLYETPTEAFEDVVYSNIGVQKDSGV